MIYNNIHYFGKLENQQLIIYWMKFYLNEIYLKFFKMISAHINRLGINRIILSLLLEIIFFIDEGTFVYFLFLSISNIFCSTFNWTFVGMIFLLLDFRFTRIASCNTHIQIYIFLSMWPRDPFLVLFELFLKQYY